MALLERGAQRAVQPVLEVEVAAPGHHVGEQVAVEGRVVLQEGLEVEPAAGRHELVQPHLLGCDLGPLALGVPVLGVGALLADTLEDHPTSLALGLVAAPTLALGTMSEAISTIRDGYTFDQPSIELGVLVDEGTPVPDVKVRISLSMLNRHGLVAGATGTGKTKTLQLMAEQISRAGVPVFAADIKGDLSGLAIPGEANPKLLERTAAIGQEGPAAVEVLDNALVRGTNAWKRKQIIVMPAANYIVAGGARQLIQAAEQLKAAFEKAEPVSAGKE